MVKSHAQLHIISSSESTAREQDLEDADLVFQLTVKAGLWTVDWTVVWIMN